MSQKTKDCRQKGENHIMQVSKTRITRICEQCVTNPRTRLRYAKRLTHRAMKWHDMRKLTNENKLDTDFTSDNQRIMAQR